MSRPKPDWMAPRGRPWRRGPARPIYDNPWINVTEYDAVEAPDHADETEDLAIVRAPFGEALEQALAGNMLDVITVASLLRVHHMAIRGELPGELTRAML